MSNPLKVGQRSSSENIVWHEASFSRGSREAQRVHRSAILWFTGLLGGGKSTFANAVNQRLFQLGHLTYVLDDDSIRHGLWNDLRFSYTDRVEIIRKIGQVAKLVFGFGVIELTVLVSPFISDRERARSLVDKADFTEGYCDAPVSVCESRYPKGLYKKARMDLIENFTGIDIHYESSTSLGLKTFTGTSDIQHSVDEIIAYLSNKDIIYSRTG